MLALGLVGCFRSAAPLIRADTADHPIVPGTSYDAVMWDFQHGQWRPAGQKTIEEDGGDYVLDFSHLLLKGIGDGYYVVQKKDTDGDPKMPYEYGLLRVEKDSILIYDMSCEPDVDTKFVLSGDIDDIDGFSPLAGCEVSSFAGLANVFRTRIANEPQPMTRYEKRPGG